MDEYLHVSGFFARRNETESSFSAYTDQEQEREFLPIFKSGFARSGSAPTAQGDEGLKDMRPDGRPGPAFGTA